MNYATLLKKPTIQKTSDVEGASSVNYLDLLACNNHGINLYDFQICTVSEYYVGRPDLVSFAFYGSDEYGDVICKVNGISNPFELNIGDILIIPEFSRVKEYIQNFISDAASKLIEEDDLLITQTNDKYKKKKNETRSPNELTIGENNYTIDRSNNLIFY